MLLLYSSVIGGGGGEARCERKSTIWVSGIRYTYEWDDMTLSTACLYLRRAGPASYKPTPYSPRTSAAVAISASVFEVSIWPGYALPPHFFKCVCCWSEIPDGYESNPPGQQFPVTETTSAQPAVGNHRGYFGSQVSMPMTMPMTTRRVVIVEM